MNLEKFYQLYVQNTKHSPSGKELINIAVFFFHYSDHQAAVYIRHALAHGMIKKNPVMPGHYIV